MSKARFKASVKAGALFKADARTDFLSVTAARYASMKDRLKRKKLPPPPFTLEAFRADVLSCMGGKKDGALICRYCLRRMTISEIAVDHATPLSRDGALDLSNLDYPCAACNDRKGSLTLADYTALLAFLGTQHPIARQDVLKRLEGHNKLAAGLRRSIMLAKGKTASAAAESRSLPLLEDAF
jgi:hypothetical protein